MNETPPLPSVLERNGPAAPRWFAAAFAAVLVAGIAGVVLTKAQLYSSSQALNPHVVSMFVPFGCCALLVAWTAATGRMSWLRLFAVSVLYLVLVAMFADVFFEPITHYPGDDPDRYSRYAHKMLEEGTLLGWDSLYWGEGVRHYVDQPGYRYYLAGMIAFLDGEHRLLQLTNMLVFLGALLFFLREAMLRVRRPEQCCFGIFLALTMPYAAKSALQGLSEWLAAAICLISAACHLRRQYLPAVTLIALAPFLRQNLLPVSVALCAFTVYVSGRKQLLLPYILVLLLPLYHNLYYAGEARLLVENKGALLSVGNGLVELMESFFYTIAWKALTYLGYAGDVDFQTLLLAWLFVPLGTALILWQFLALRGGTRWFYVTLFVLTTGPTVLFGSAYFPRFVFLNQIVLLATALLLRVEHGRDGI